MAKKTLIYDFSALKGTVTFSEPKPAIPETKPSVISTSVTTVKEPFQEAEAFLKDSSFNFSLRHSGRLYVRTSHIKA